MAKKYSKPELLAPAGSLEAFFAAMEAGADDRFAEAMPARPEWDSALWLVTHVDLHRTTKVQAFLNFLKEEAKAW